MAYADQKAYRERRRRKALSYLGAECARCQSDEGLHFDHIDPATKIKEISQAIIAGWSWVKLVDELDKCQLLCQPCHLEKSRSEGSLCQPSNKILDPQHGTARMYADRCRCTLCKTWKREYRLGHVDSLGQSRPCRVNG